MAQAPHEWLIDVNLGSKRRLRRLCEAIRQWDDRDIRITCSCPSPVPDLTRLSEAFNWKRFSSVEIEISDSTEEARRAIAHAARSAVRVVTRTVLNDIEVAPPAVWRRGEGDVGAFRHPPDGPRSGFTETIDLEADPTIPDAGPPPPDRIMFINYRGGAFDWDRLRAYIGTHAVLVTIKSDHRLFAARMCGAREGDTLAHVYFTDELAAAAELFAGYVETHAEGHLYAVTYSHKNLIGPPRDMFTWARNQIDVTLHCVGLTSRPNEQFAGKMARAAYRGPKVHAIDVRSSPP